MKKQFFLYGVIITSLILSFALTSACNRVKSSISTSAEVNANQNPNDITNSSLHDLNEAKNISSTVPVIEDSSDQWDEASATNLVMDELKKYADWEFEYEVDYSEDLIHRLIKFQEVKLDNKKLISGLVLSKLTDSYMSTEAYVSIFEFENKGGWRLTNKAIAFASYNFTGNVTWIRIAPNNYALYILNSYSRMDETNAFTNLYTFLNGEISNILSIEHGAGYDETYYNVRFKQSDITNNNGYYYLLAEEKSKIEDRDTVVTGNTYAFNGAVFEEFEGSITDPSLTSMNRFIDINSMMERENDICPTCHGTGEIICPLCGGTGVNNMGIECGCIRTYNMEKAAGHTPSHPPLRWTCPACGGSGKPS